MYLSLVNTASDTILNYSTVFLNDGGLSVYIFFNCFFQYRYKCISNSIVAFTVYDSPTSLNMDGGLNVIAEPGIPSLGADNKTHVG